MQENRTAIRIAIQSNVFITGPPLILPTVQVVVAISSSGLIHICTVRSKVCLSLFKLGTKRYHVMRFSRRFGASRSSVRTSAEPNPLPIPRLLSVVDQNIPIVAHIINV